MKYLAVNCGVEELGFLTICALHHAINLPDDTLHQVITTTKANWEILTKQDKQDISDIVTGASKSRIICDRKLLIDFIQWILSKSNLENKI